MRLVLDYFVFYGGNYLNYKRLLFAGSALLFGASLLASTNETTIQAAKKDDSEQTTQTTTEDKVKSTTKKATEIIKSYSLMTKVAGKKNYRVWHAISDGHPVGKVADGIDFRYNHLQSNQSIKTRKYTYWLIYVDGRRVGWINQRYFARNQISVPKTISLVRNDNYSFNPLDAISYATDDTGTVADTSMGTDEVGIEVSKDSIDCSEPGSYKVTYSYGAAHATSRITVRKSTSEGIGDDGAVTAKAGVNNLKSWSTHYGSSINYISPSDFVPEKQLHSWSANGLTMKTRFYQPVLLSVKTDTNEESSVNRVGHIPEGVTVSNGWVYTSLLAHTYLMQGHIVGYNLNKLKNPYDAQYLLTMSQKKFNQYVQNIKVSPFIPVGHGQAMGSTNKYVYVLVNNNKTPLSKDSEELIQIRKSDMQINKLWTIKCWNGSDNDPRYFQNAVVTTDHQMYGVYYDKSKDQYEYWELNRTGDNWYPRLVGATKSTFVGNGAPVQGFTYDPVNRNFYLAFNDLIVKISKDGNIQQSYSFTSGREIEGVSVSAGHLYANLAQRAELLRSVQKLN